MKQNTGFWFSNGIVLCFCTTTISAQALPVPDATLPNNSNVTNQGNTNVITGGTRAGGNLFHSFQQFSIPTNGVAYFNNALDVQNIISRVTGSSISNINGAIKANGTANLFLLNPNGIIFGPNAELNIGGSFLGTTASSIKFANGTQFSAINPQSSPLLTISVPIGLGFTGNPGSIQLQGIGHNLIQPGSEYTPDVGLGSIPIGLGVQPGHTLALVGGDVTFAGGIATALSGRIEIGSVSSGQISITPNSLKGFTLGYQGIQDFRDILLSRRSLLNASGTANGNIQVLGRNIKLTDSSLIFVENQGVDSLGAIKLTASNSLEINGNTAFTPVSSGFQNFSSGLLSETFDGKGADITISAKQLVVQNSGRIYVATFGSGDSGTLNVNTSEFVQILGNSPFALAIPSGSNVSTSTAGLGHAGTVTVNTKKLLLQDGGHLVSAVFSSAAGGDVNVNASESINVAGSPTNTFISTLISSITNASGSAGRLTINTKGLTVLDGGRVDSSTFASGPAGKVTINASDFVDVNGMTNGSTDPSLIISAATSLDSNGQRLLGSRAPLTTGRAGNIDVNTGRLSVINGAKVTVENDGTGDAGKLTVNARSIFLDNKGGITASTASGEGGNISVSARDLRLQRGSSIDASALGGTKRGGNIALNTDTLETLDSSSIKANAFGGPGGNIQINTQGLFRSPDSVISASSRYGISGTVRINVPYIDFASTTDIRVTPLQVTQFSSVCSRRKGSAPPFLANAGTGGTPPDSDDLLGTNAGWGNHSASGEVTEKSRKQALRHGSNRPELVQAQGWVRRPNGIISLVAAPPGTILSPSSPCFEQSRRNTLESIENK